MRLSRKAQQLLDKIKDPNTDGLTKRDTVEQLESMHCRDLLDVISAIKFNKSLETEVDFEDPVLLSSGFIYDRIFVVGLTHCSYSGERLDPEIHIPLPQIRTIVDDFKEFRSQFKSNLPTQLTLSAKVSGNKFRMVVNSSSQAALEVLGKYLSLKLPETSEIDSRTTGGYFAKGFSRCWGIAAGVIRLEFWFPTTPQRLTDYELNKLISKLIAHINFGTAICDTDDMSSISITRLGVRQYADAILPAHLMLEEALHVCNELLDETDKLVAKRAAIMEDRVVSTEVAPVRNAVHLGMVMFCAPVTGVSAQQLIVKSPS